mmetsp:Transcript_10817/g.31389  ORF Transcript_10817/g.31389 Transcript_10817/m.31389 type:complete len:226 (+) Transcript_10817:408-1085(+)
MPCISASWCLTNSSVVSSCATSRRLESVSRLRRSVASGTCFSCKETCKRLRTLVTLVRRCSTYRRRDLTCDNSCFVSRIVVLSAAVVATKSLRASHSISDSFACISTRHARLRWRAPSAVSSFLSVMDWRRWDAGETGGDVSSVCLVGSLSDSCMSVVKLGRARGTSSPSRLVPLLEHWLSCGGAAGAAGCARALAAFWARPICSRLSSSLVSCSPALNRCSSSR